MLHARRLSITIPTPTSRTMFEPKYLVPLLEAKYRPLLPDMIHKIEATEIPTNLRTPTNVWRQFATVEEELDRLQLMFSSVVDNYGRPVIEIVYPGNALREAIMAEVEAAEDEMERASVTIEMPKEITDLTCVGFSDEGRRALVAHGITSLSAIASLPKEKLASLPGIGLRVAGRLIQAASKANIVEKPKSKDAAGELGMPISTEGRAVPLFPDGEGSKRNRIGRGAADALS